MPRDRRHFRLITLVALWGSTAVRADDAPTLGRDVLPLLKARCVKCHGPGARKAKLNLASPKGVARGGKGGAVVVAGRAEASPLWRRVEADEMPPEEPLDDREKEVLRRWIDGGAAGLPKVRSDEPEGADHWAFAPATRPAVPSIRDGARARNAVDAFLLEALQAKGLGLAPEADRATLIRRLSLDLLGLLPAPEEAEAFVADRSPDAYERLVDRLLASPHYGERWGKFWLDAAGFADSNGYFAADSDRPLAYRYRDYVIRSWNADTPFDRFVVEQLAGDELAGFEAGGTATREQADLLAATHFLRNAPDGTGESDGNPDELRADRYAVLEGTTQVLGSVLFGLTFQCARCHDHKFEPVAQRDYYAIYSVLYPAFDVDRWARPNDRVVEAPLAEERAAWERHSRAIDEEIAAAKIGHLFKKPFAGEKSRRALEDAVRKVEVRRGGRPGRIAWVGERPSAAAVAHLLKRGVYNAPGPAVEPAPPSILRDPGDRFEVVPTRAKTTGRRLAFARWLTRPGSRASALLARVTVNRIWQHHFGTGLVATPDNLGYSGAPPSHPELLEYLASEFARGGWRAKRLHRLIVTSAAYRQASAPREDLKAIDPDDRLLGRYPPRRLDAEAIRDAMLAASGELDARMGGPYVPSTRTASGEVVIAESTAGARRRSIYLQSRRTQVPSVLEVFDAPSIVANCTRRNTSTMPLQSLSLLNSEFAVRRGRALAARAVREAGPGPEDRVRRAFMITLGRPPTDRERAASLRFLAEQPAAYPEDPDATDRAWADFGQMILASNAFLYVD